MYSNGSQLLVVNTYYTEQNKYVQVGHGLPFEIHYSKTLKHLKPIKSVKSCQ